MEIRIRQAVFQGLGILLCLLTLAEVNYPMLTPQSQLAVFALLGLSLVFLKCPLHKRFQDHVAARALDWILLLAVVLCFSYVVVQTEPWFSDWWIGGSSLGNRAGNEAALDHFAGLVGVVLVLEAARRAIGWTLPLLALTFLAYGAFGSHLPDWLFPHRGYDWQRLVSQTFLHSQGVFGIALKVMFTYVFLFVLFGALLEKTGGTGFIIGFARRLFGNSPGGPAKVAVISSGMMGSLSGSAVANTATTGAFTIPMMRASGFSPRFSAAVEAAASSGGALVPPVMGAGAYMMLEIIDPPVTFIQIVRAAIIPAALYYLALLLIVHFYAKRVGGSGEREEKPPVVHGAQGVVFFGAFFALIAFLAMGFTPFRAVSLSLLVILGICGWHPKTRVNFKQVKNALIKTSSDGVILIAAASCVGIIIGVVTLTGVGSKLPSLILPLAQEHLLLALILLMFCTIILGMGLPSAVCYLLMATLVGSALGSLGIVPLAAHLFIFYFGMMSMVTPPVALAAYAAGTIAGTDIMKTGVKAFQLSLAGFALPYAFVMKPQLLMMSADGTPAGWWAIFGAVLLTLLGIICLTVGISGYFQAPLRRRQRLLLFAAAAYFILMRPEPVGMTLALAVMVGVLAVNRRRARAEAAVPIR